MKKQYQVQVQYINLAKKLVEHNFSMIAHSQIEAIKRIVALMGKPINELKISITQKHEVPPAKLYLNSSTGMLYTKQYKHDYYYPKAKKLEMV